MSVEFKFSNKVSAALRGAHAVVVLAPKGALEDGWHRTALGTDWAAQMDRAASDASPGDLGTVMHTYGVDGAPRHLFLAALPDKVGRHNSPTRAEMIRTCMERARPGPEAKKMAVVCYLDDASHHLAAAVSVARTFSEYSQKSGNGKKAKQKFTVTIAGALADGTSVRTAKNIAPTVDAVRLAARLVDTPCQEMKTADMEAEARAAVKGMTGVKVRSIVGDRLLNSKMGGIHGVGRTATVAPRLVILEYKPKGKARRKVGLVGKGIVYDTGGLSIKVGGYMSNMKSDMGGAAAVLGAFTTLAKSNSKDHIYALLCLAENAVGPDSYRPDDILHMHSGKSVEINNTDAEGRLVLGDGVSYAARNLKCDLVIDAATLTGAALIATGMIISCVVSNRDGVEAQAVASGKITGDLTHPIIFVPEFMRSEFTSKVADMKNSVKNRMNAQSSAAAQFVYNHIDDVNPAWAHLDIAGPAFRDGRGTGYGVALIADLVNNVSASDLKE